MIPTCEEICAKCEQRVESVDRHYPDRCEWRCPKCHHLLDVNWHDEPEGGGEVIPVEQTKPYQEGRKAWLDGKSENCPYPIGNPNRTNWYTGWLDAKYEAKYP